MKRFTCDHCGEDINEHDDYIDHEIDFDDCYYECDLCAACKDKIYRSIHSAIEIFIGDDTK